MRQQKLAGFFHPQGFFLGKNDVPGIFKTFSGLSHTRRDFFFGKNDVPGIQAEHRLREQGTQGLRGPAVFRPCRGGRADAQPQARP